MRESSNPFYILLLISSLAFVITALAYALVPPDRQPAWFLRNGWLVLLAEVAAMLLFGLLSMGLDRWRTLRRAPSADRPGQP